MKPETRDKIRTYLQQLIDANIQRAESKQLDDIGTVSEYLQRTDKDGNLQPFYYADLLEIYHEVGQANAARITQTLSA